MTEQTTATAVHLEITVHATQERAFQVFTQQLDLIKPREHNLLAAPIAETVLEPREGGDVYDRGTDGSICRWARVLAFEPSDRLVISWDISPQWQLESDLAKTSEVEIRFVAEGTETTRVTLDHRHLDRHSQGWEGCSEVLASDDAWPLYLRRFADLVDA